MKILDKNKYKEELDKVRFSEDFEEKTVKLIREYVSEKEDAPEASGVRRPFWGILILACVIIITFSNLGITAREAWEKNHGGAQTQAAAAEDEYLLEEDLYIYADQYAPVYFSGKGRLTYDDRN